MQGEPGFRISRDATIFQLYKVSESHNLSAPLERHWFRICGHMLYGYLPLLSSLVW